MESQLMNSTALIRNYYEQMGGVVRGIESDN